MLIRRLYYLLAAAACVMFYFSYQKWFSWIVLIAVLALPWFSLLLSLRAMFCTRMRLTAPERVMQDSYADVSLGSRSPVPPAPYDGGIRVTRTITGESWILYPGAILPTEHCGALILRMEKEKVYDYLGLFSLKLRNPPVCVVRVMPRQPDLPIPEELPQYASGAWRAKQNSAYGENHEIRPYQPGDPMTLVHWKLSVKAGEMMLREPVEPAGGTLRLLLDLCGTPDELDSKFTQLLYYGNWLLRRSAAFEVLALTGKGVESWTVSSEWDLNRCVDALLCDVPVKEGTILSRKTTGGRIYIGGDSDET